MSKCKYNSYDADESDCSVCRYDKKYGYESTKNAHEEYEDETNFHNSISQSTSEAESRQRWLNEIEEAKRINQEEFNKLRFETNIEYFRNKK